MSVHHQVGVHIL